MKTQIDIGSLVEIGQDAQVFTITEEGTIPVFRDDFLHGIVIRISPTFYCTEYEVLIGTHVLYVQDVCGAHVTDRSDNGEN